MNSAKTNVWWVPVLRSVAAAARRCALALAFLCALWASAAPRALAQTETVLYSFTGVTDGGFPVEGLIRDAEGNLYGTTPEGGLLHKGCGSGGCGAVFEVTPAGTEIVLYTFTGKNGDGKAPFSRLILDGSDNLYGTTLLGGDAGKGIVFEVTSSGTETVLYSFVGGADGAFPESGLVRDAKGNFYGTTSGGGHYHGTVFELSPAGAEKVVFSFPGQDGTSPGSALIRAAGNLYGTSSQGGGGSGCAPPGCGLVFEVTPNGSERTIYTFTGGADGARPAGSLVRDALGNLYGTASWGGTLNSSCPQGCGTVYELSPGAGGTWNLTVLHSFTGEGDGYHPVASLVRDAKGNLYGITSGEICSGPACSGTIFAITPNGMETVLYSFTGGADGLHPYGDLVRDKKGNLYGTTERGGTFGNGTVYRVTP
jgi:uncharacterized repeat protein (TIGR03803 family)